MTKTDILNGYSGFQLTVSKKKRGFSFSKVSKKDPERLVRQARKQNFYRQELLSTNLNLVFEIPEIFSIEKNKISMNYYFGKSIIDFLQTEDCSSFDWLIENLKSLIEWEFTYCKPKRIKLESFESKLKNVPNHNNFHREILTRVKNEYIPVGFCHGDLTLSNLVISRKIILVDFHDPFIETPIQDMVKLLQEVDLKWSLQMYKKSPDLEKINIAYEYLRKKVYDLVEYLSESNGIQRSTIFTFHLMVLVRLLAYSKDKEMETKIINKCLELIKNEEKFNSSYSWRK